MGITLQPHPSKEVSYPSSVQHLSRLAPFQFHLRKKVIIQLELFFINGAPVWGGTNELVCGIERSYGASEIAPGILVVFGAVPAAEIRPSCLAPVQTTRRTGFVGHEVSNQLFERQIA